MRKPAVVYLIVTLVCLGLVLLMLVPGMLIFVLIITFGIALLLIQPFLQLTLWLAIFAPGAMGLLVNRWLGAGLAAVSVGLVLSFPSWLPDPARSGLGLLEPPSAAKGPVTARSVSIDFASLPRDLSKVEDEVLRGLLSNHDLDWVRIETRRSMRLYERKDGIMVRRTGGGPVEEADITVLQPEYGGELLSGFGLSPWKVQGARGYVILGKGRAEPLARNLGLTLLRGDNLTRITVEGVSMDSSSRPRIELVRVPVGSVVADSDRSLTEDLRVLGLIPGSEEPVFAEGMNSADAVDRVVRQLIQEREQNDPRRYGSGNWSKQEKRALQDFSLQLERRINIAERADLIVRGERLGIVGPKSVVMAIAGENPEIMQKMVAHYHLDVAGEADEDILRRIERDDMAPLARAVGRDPVTFEALFDGSRLGTRRVLIDAIFKLDLEDPYGILAGVFDEFPPLTDLDERLTPEYFESWSSRDYGRDVLSGKEIPSVGVGHGTDEGLADHALETLLSQPSVPPEVIRDFVFRWTLTRSVPYMFEPELLRSALDALAHAGLAEEHAKLSQYFMHFPAPPEPAPEPPVAWVPFNAPTLVQSDILPH